MEDDVAHASISRHRRRDGSIAFRVRGWLNGERESIGLFDDEQEAEDIRAAWLERNSDAPEGMTLGAWGARWLDLRETSGAHRNARGDRSRWARYVAGTKIAGMLIRRVTRAHLVAWLDDVVRLTPVRATTVAGKTVHVARAGERLSEQTVKHALRLLSKCLADAAERGHVAANAAAGMKSPKLPGKPKKPRWYWLRAHEIAKVAALPVSAKLRRHGGGSERDALAPKQRSAFLVAIYTGLREGEVWGLRWCDVRLDARPELHVRRSFGGPTKTDRERHVPLLPEAVAELLRWRELSPGVGERRVWGEHTKGYDAGWEQVARRLGIAARFHDLRHTCASHLVQGTWTPTPLSLIEVRDWLGHDSITTTQRYAHLAPGGLHAAISRKPATVTGIETKRRKK